MVESSMRRLVHLGLEFPSGFDCLTSKLTSLFSDSLFSELRFFDLISSLSFEQDINQLTQSLAPFFHISHPSRGEIKGPYSKLPLKVQTRAQGLVYFLLEPQVEEDDSNEESETEAEQKLRASVKKAGVALVE